MRDLATSVCVLIGLGSLVMAAASTASDSPSPLQLAGAPTIDRIDLDWTGDSYIPGTPGDPIKLLGQPRTHFYSDGTTWQSTAGTWCGCTADVERVEVEGQTVRYFLRPRNEGIVYSQETYDGLEHSSVGRLAAEGELILEATIGSRTAVLRGYARIVENAPAKAPVPVFEYYSAVLGSVVPFEQTYTTSVAGVTWQPDSFERHFYYTRSNGRIDFDAPISMPEIVGLEIAGVDRVPSEYPVTFHAVARYENGRARDVSREAVWSVAPTSGSTIEHGTLTVGPLSADDRSVEISALLELGGATFRASRKLAVVEREGMDAQPGVWSTFQGEHRHSGHVPLRLEPAKFSLRWERTVGPGYPLNAVAAGEGRVFVSLSNRNWDDTDLYALDARNGTTLWSHGFGRASSVAAPAFAYGNVYVQTGEEYNFAAQPPLLHALDSETGELRFMTATAERGYDHLAPTPLDGVVYVHSGIPGGMYGIDAFSGRQSWFAPLPRYDRWTPAADTTHVYAYVGGGASAALVVVDRASGEQVVRIPDGNFLWNVDRHHGAPVLGGRDDVIVIQSSRRLLRFDLVAASIAWERYGLFLNPPAVHDGEIYAVEAGGLVAVDQDTGDELWRWSPAGGESLVGQVIATDAHLFVRGASTTYAIDLASRAAVWSYPRSGELAIADGTLYIARSDGLLTAIDTPEYAVVPPAAVEIEAPADISEHGTVMLRARVEYEDGRVRDASDEVHWSIDPADAGEISAAGELTIGELFEPSLLLTVRAEYTENGVTVSGTRTLTAKISVSVEEFVRRNLAAARQLRVSVAPALEEARAREAAAHAVLATVASEPAEGSPSRRGATRVLRRLRAAIFWGGVADRALDQSVDELGGALEQLEEPERNPPERDRRSRHSQR